jgi:hypothetical protein
MLIFDEGGKTGLPGKKPSKKESTKVHLFNDFLPNMWLRPRVAGDVLSSSHFVPSIHVVSSSSITPLSWKFKIASEISLLHGEPYETIDPG